MHDLVQCVGALAPRYFFSVSVATPDGRLLGVCDECARGVMDDVVTRMMYDEAVELCVRLAAELAEETLQTPAPTPHKNDLADRVLEAQKTMRQIRRQMIVEIAG